MVIAWYDSPNKRYLDGLRVVFPPRRSSLVVVVLQEDPLDNFEFDFLVPLVYLPVVLLLVPLVLVYLRVYFNFPSVEHALEIMAQ